MLDAAEAAIYALIATIVLLAAHVVQLLIEKRRKCAPKVAKPTSQFLQDAAPVLIVFASVTGTSRRLAARLREALAKAGRASIVVDAAKPQLDPWDELLNGDSRDCAVLVSTVHGPAPEPLTLLVEELDDIAADHRVGQGALRGGASRCWDVARRPTTQLDFVPRLATEKTLRKLERRASLPKTRRHGGDRGDYVAWEHE